MAVWYNSVNGFRTVRGSDFSAGDAVSAMEQENNLKTVLFDMYGVIPEESKGNFIPYMYKSFDEREYGRLTKLIREDRLFTKASNGDITSDIFLAELGFADPHFHMVDCLDNYLISDEGVVPLAELAELL